MFSRCPLAAMSTTQNPGFVIVQLTPHDMSWLYTINHRHHNVGVVSFEGGGVEFVRSLSMTDGSGGSGGGERSNNVHLAVRVLPWLLWVGRGTRGTAAYRDITPRGRWCGCGVQWMSRVDSQRARLV